MNIVFLILILILASCSSPNLPEESRGEQYFTEWSTDFYSENLAFQGQYKNYLHTVEDFFHNEDQTPKFEAYLSSSTNFFQLLAHSEFNLPTFYRRLKGSKADLNTKMFEDFKNRNLGLQYDKLNKERENKLREDLGFTLFEKLKVHYQQQGFPSQTFPRFPM